MGVFRYPKHYDVLVIGAGHAGIEAALAANRPAVVDVVSDLTVLAPMGWA